MVVIYYSYAYYTDPDSLDVHCSWKVWCTDAGWKRFDCHSNESVWLIPGTIDPSI